MVQTILGIKRNQVLLPLSLFLLLKVTMDARKMYLKSNLLLSQLDALFDTLGGYDLSLIRLLCVIYV